jgi:hypothetical protein
LLQEWGEKANASEPEIARALEMLASAQLLPLGTGKEVVGSALYELACAKAWELLGIDRLADQQHGAGTLKEAVFAAFASWPNKDTARMEKFGPLGLARELASGPGITVVKDYFYAVKALAAQRPAHWNEAGWRFPYQLGAENYLVSERLQDLWSKANKDLGFKEPPEKSHYETHFLPFYSDNGLIDQFVGAIARAASDQNSDQGHPEVAERCAAYWILTMENFGLGEGKPLLNPFEREIYEPRRIPKPGDKITVAELLEGIEDATLRTVVIDWLRGLQPRNRDDTGYEHLFPRSGDDLERR